MLLRVMLFYSQRESAVRAKRSEFKQYPINWILNNIQPITHKIKYNSGLKCETAVFNPFFHLLNDNGFKQPKSNSCWYLKIAHPLTGLIIEMKVVWRRKDESGSVLSYQISATRGIWSISLVIIRKRNKYRSVIILNDIESRGM